MWEFTSSSQPSHDNVRVVNSKTRTYYIRTVVIEHAQSKVILIEHGEMYKKISYLVKIFWKLYFVVWRVL
jgi:wyosine [tRNA(Phe)-imidazoG37] synthetase (radical SAM superfamily)